MTETADPDRDPASSSPTDPADPAESATGPAPRSRAPLFISLVVAGICLSVGAVIGFLVLDGDDGGPSETVIEVEAGTYDRMADGEELELVPDRLELEVGDTLVIVNRDDALHQVGPYTVAPHQTLRQTFTAAGTVSGPCSLHPSGEVTIEIR